MITLDIKEPMHLDYAPFGLKTSWEVQGRWDATHALGGLFWLKFVTCFVGIWLAFMIAYAVKCYHMLALD